ncbi:ACR domain-containing protein [Clostridiaceae bacterium JG1575]|nr:ACR domain-containing protein [Clostridiaceae bacterium JG1575]
MSLIRAYLVAHPPILVPQVGRGEERAVQKTRKAFAEIRQDLQATAPETVLLISPHMPSFEEAFALAQGSEDFGSLAAFGAPQVASRVVYDREFQASLEECAEKAGLPLRSLSPLPLDHGALVPLSELQSAVPRARWIRLAPCGRSLADHYRMGLLLQQTADALHRNVSLIASGDLSHALTPDAPCGYYEEGARYDAQVMEHLAQSDFLSILNLDPALVEKAMACAPGPLALLFGFLDGRQVISEVLSYEGPFGVGYGVCRFTPGDLDPQRRCEAPRESSALAPPAQALCSLPVLLARSVLWHQLNHRSFSLEAFCHETAWPRDFLTQPRGVFVCLHRGDTLRGCMGTLEPTTQSTREEIVQNAGLAAFEDPRFPPVSLDEWPSIRCSVEVLGPLEDVADAAHLDPRRYGVVVCAKGRKGVLLPNLPGIETAAQQVDIARQKAGLSADTPLALSRFEVVRYQ